MNLGAVFSFIKNQASSKDEVNSSVGIDIGTSAIKVVELKRADGKVSLGTYGELQLGPYNELAIGQVTALEAERQIEALVDIMREAGVTSTHGTFAVPLSSSFLTVIDLLQNDTEDSTEGMIKVEARKYIPVPLNEVALDWQQIDLTESESEVRRHVLLAAIQHQSLATFQSLMRAVNLHSEPAEIEAFSTIRSCTKAVGERSADEEEYFEAVIDFGAATTKLYVVKNGVLYNVHTVQAASQSVTKRLSELRNISFADAELLKRNITNEAKNDLRTAVQSVYERTTQEIYRVLTDVEKRFATPVTTIKISGGGARVYGLEQFVAERLQRTVSHVDSFMHVEYPMFMSDFLGPLGGTFAPALGAALRTMQDS